MDPRNYDPGAPGSLQYTPEGYWTYHPHPLPPYFRWTGRLVAALSAADRALARLQERLSAQPPGFTELVIRLEAVDSCRLSDLAVDLEGLIRLEAGYFREIDPDKIGEMAGGLRAVEALDWAWREGRRRRPSLADIRELHRRLWFGPVDPRWPPGEFRAGQTWVGGEGPAEAEYVPPPPEAMEEALESLAGFLSQPPELPPAVTLAFVHYQFAAVHPFYIANGRTGRALIQMLLPGWGLLPQPGLPMSGFLRRQAGEAARQIAQVRQEDAWEGWLVFFLEGLEESAQRVLDLHARLELARARLRELVAGERNAARLQRVVDLLVGRPCVNVGQVQAVLQGGNFKSAARAVEALGRLGVLEEVTGQARHRVFRAREVWGAIVGEE